MSGDRIPPGVTLPNWDLGGEPSAWAFLHAGKLLRAVEIPLARRPAALDHAEQAQIGQFEVQPGMSLDQYVATGPVSGIVVVRSGRIAFERYPRMRPGDRHLLMSVTKAMTSALIGVLVPPLLNWASCTSICSARWERACCRPAWVKPSPTIAWPGDNRKSCSGNGFHEPQRTLDFRTLVERVFA